ncbi:predicted protein, partial [Scheffersomyces stipitis CBS 6054]
PLNDCAPVRIALLGGPRSGKTSTISKLTADTFNDTYYPTHSINPVLFHYKASSFLPRLILDETEPENSLSYFSKQSRVLLSPVLYQTYLKSNKKKTDISHNSEIAYIPPQTTPVLVELIDTPSFNPQQVVPFLEASIYHKLDKDILRNLANEPRKPVSTNPLLVASGASELNGNIDGYFFVYSAVPSYNPPSYEETIDPIRIERDETFKLLSIMKGALDEAWKEYNSFKKRWNLGKEHDIFSFKNAMKSIWKDKNIHDVANLREQLSKEVHLYDNSVDPADPDCPPPIWIICTHTKSQLASPKLISNGKKVSKFWKCGFVAIDNEDNNVDEVLALMLREIVERK